MLRKLYFVGVLVVWTGFIAGIVGAELVTDLHGHTLALLGVLGVPVLLGTLVVGLKVWSGRFRPPSEVRAEPPLLPAQWRPEPPAWTPWSTAPLSAADAITVMMDPIAVKPPPPTVPARVVGSAHPVAVVEDHAEPHLNFDQATTLLAGYDAGAHPELDDRRRPDVDHLKGFAEGAVDRGRADDDMDA